MATGTTEPKAWMWTAGTLMDTTWRNPCPSVAIHPGQVKTEKLMDVRSSTKAAPAEPGEERD